MAENKIVNADKLQGLIYTIRGVQVMYDSDFAELYGVEIKRLNEQVKRNRERFPEEFTLTLQKSKMPLVDPVSAGRSKASRVKL